MTDDTRYAETRNRQDDVETTPAPSAGRVLHGLSIKHGTGSAKQDGTRRQWWVTDLARTSVSPPTEGGADTDAAEAPVERVAGGASVEVSDENIEDMPTA